MLLSNTARVGHIGGRPTNQNFLWRTRILHTRPHISYLLNFRLKFATIDIVTVVTFFPYYAHVWAVTILLVIMPMFGHTRNDILTST